MKNYFKKIQKTFSILILIVLSGCSFLIKSQKVIAEKDFMQMIQGNFENIKNVIDLFPKSIADVDQRFEWSIQLAKKDLNEFLSIKSDERTFANTAQFLDDMQNGFSIALVGIKYFELVCPDTQLRQHCHDTEVKMRSFYVDTFYDVQIYKAFKDYIDGNAKKENLNDEQKYFLQESMKDFVRQGFNLPEKEFEEVKSLQKEILKFAAEFDKNINTDKSQVVVKKEELKGLEPDFIENLQKTDDGDYILKCDYPTVFEVRDNCSVVSTRKKLYSLFNNRAYPQNIELLNDVIKKRDELSKKLGFESFAHLDLDSQMVKKPKKAIDFLTDLIEKAKNKTDKEFALLTQELPEGVVLDKDGKMAQWDFAYVENQYKKKNFDVDERKIAEYFPVENTIENVFEIYQQFLGLEFKFADAKDLWDEDVKLVQVYEKNSKQQRGYLFLDLYPRDNKYPHACMAGVVPTTEKKDAQTGEITKIPAVILIVANFPKATKDKPALLKHDDVETFFHEFGHAMHDLLGRTQMPSFSGTNVKTDFVEMPSQMFEEWLWDKEILKKITKHYKTGESLPDELIDKKIELKKFDKGYFLTKQGFYSLLALQYFASGDKKDTSKILQDLFEKYIKHLRFDPEIHFQASFAHLMGYGAKYYSYMWSKVFALDLFYEVKKHGLLDRNIGKKLDELVLGKGGSVEPDILLKNFLGREPNQEAFFKDLGII